MAAPIEVSYHRFDPPETLRDKIGDLVGELDKFENDIIAGRVVVEGAQRHGSKTVVEIKVELDLKGHKAVGKRTAEYPDPAGQRTVERAATEAFHVAARQLKKHGQALREDVKTLDHAIEVGRVYDIDLANRNGFIEMPDGSSLFFSEAVLRNADFEALFDGDTVRVVRHDEEGVYGPEASWVEPAAPDTRQR